jgi:hypothetical protein
VLDGGAPAHVPDAVIAELKARERGGLVVLPERPAFRRGDPVRIARGAFAGSLGLYQGQRAHQRIEILLSLLGAAV